MREIDYRPDIDGLRAIAVTAVVFFHAFPNLLPGGFVGVDVFFVISGYLITGIILREQNAGKFSLVAFYMKRARRIFPALSLVLAACLAAGWFLLLPDEYALLGKHTAGGSAFIANLVFMSEAGYFDISGTFKPLLHLWSLGIEEQFYLIWPALLMLAPLLKVPKAPIIATIAAISFAYCLWLMGANHTEAFYMPISRFWELMLGAGLAVTAARGALPTGRMADLLAVVGLVLVLAAMFIVREDSGFPAPFALLPVVGTALLIWSGANSVINRAVLARSPFVAIGLVSYPLYLWHWPLLAFPAILASGETSDLVRGVAVIASLLLAVLTYRGFELPLRRAFSLRELAIGSTAALVAIGCLGLWIFMAGGLSQRPISSQSEVVQSDFSGPIGAHRSNDLCLDTYSVPGQEAYGWFFCIKSGEGASDVLLIGDSFANHYYAGLVAHPAFAGDVVLSIGSCEPSLIRPEEVVEVAETFDPCTPVRKFDQQQLIDQIIETEKPRLVIMGEMNSAAPGGVPNTTQNYIDRVLERIAYIRNSGAKVIVIRPHLRSTYFTRGCFSRPLAPAEYSCEVDSSVGQSHSNGTQPLAAAIMAEFPDVAVVNPDLFMCDESVCSFVRDGRPLFRDEYDHFSIYGSELAFKALMEQVISSHPDLLSE